MTTENFFKDTDDNIFVDTTGNIFKLKITIEYDTDNALQANSFETSFIADSFETNFVANVRQ